MMQETLIPKIGVVTDIRIDTPDIKDAGYLLRADMDLVDLFMGSQGTLDDYSYLDLNSMLLQPAAYALDDGHALFGMVRLEE